MSESKTGEPDPRLAGRAKGRAGQPGDTLGAALWNVGDADGSGGADLVWRTSTGGARLGGACP